MDVLETITTIIMNVGLGVGVTIYFLARDWKMIGEITQLMGELRGTMAEIKDTIKEMRGLKHE